MTIAAESFAGRILAILSRRSPGFRPPDPYVVALNQISDNDPKARIAGLTALSRIGQTDPDRRQLVADTLCSYLRVDPFLSFKVEKENSPVAAGFAEEFEVRRTAQRLLEKHLIPVRDQHGEPTSEIFWPNIDVNLRGALLENWNLRGGSARNADFQGARFIGNASFDQFEFQDDANFGQVRFDGPVDFTRVQFHGLADFSGAVFDGSVEFRAAQFLGAADFSGASSAGVVEFREVQFHGLADFSGAVFDDSVEFRAAQFRDTVNFSHAQLHEMRFRSANFGRKAFFADALFGEPVEFKSAKVRLTRGENQDSVWPDGWTVIENRLEDQERDQWGTLVPLVVA